MARPYCKRKLKCNSRTIALIFGCLCIVWLGITVIVVERENQFRADKFSDEFDIASRKHKHHLNAYSARYKFRATNLTRCQHNFNDITQPKFQKLHSKVYLLSAYYDNRKEGSPFFRILALLSGAMKSTAPLLYCHMIDVDGVTVVKEIKEYVFNENLNSVYGGYILSCPLHDVRLDDVCFVKISLRQQVESSSSSSITLPVLTWDHDQFEGDFAICVPPLFGNLEPINLVEFVEMHRILGVEQVFFYDYKGTDEISSTNSAIRQVVDYYVRKGTVTSYEWSLPLPLNFIRYYGQLLTVHHCMFTNVLRYKYIAFLDLDEFIMPRNKLVSWYDIINEIDDGSYSGFRFKSASFPPYFNSAKNGNSIAPLVTLGWIKRAVGYHTKRTKCIVRPERMFEMGVHHISKWNEEHWPPLDVHVDIGQVHHYRACFSSFFQGNCNNIETDDTALRYSTVLTLAYEKTMKELNETFAALPMHENDK